MGEVGPGLLKESCLSLKISLSESSTPPSEFRIFKNGKNSTSKGVFLFTDKSAVSCLSAAEDYGNEFCIDYDHGMVSGRGDIAESSKAAGWFLPEVRDGELWATQVSWTPKAAKMLSEREYRYFSPAFRHGEGGEINSLINVAITNLPATKRLTPLVANQSPDELSGTNKPESYKMNITSLLSLKETATETEVAARITALTASHAEVLNLTDKQTMAEAIGVLMAWKDSGEKVTALSLQLSAMQAEKRESEVKAIVSESVKQGKVTPAQVEFLTKLGNDNIETLKSFISTCSVIVPVAAKEAPVSMVAALSAEAEKLARLFGRNPEELAKFMAGDGAVKVQSTVEE